MLDAVVGCHRPRDANPYWAHFLLVALLLTWGVIVRRREQVQRRPALGILAAAGWVLTVGHGLLDRRIDDQAFLLSLLQAAAFTTGCVLFEIIISPRRELVPRAILVRDE